MRKTLLAVVAAAALTTGVASWHGLAAEPQKAATISTPIAHAIAGGRDSYADVVGVAAPAVVTIRTEGKAKMMPTMFDGSDGQDGQDPQDFLRRLFGEQFGGRVPRGPLLPRSGRATRMLGLGP